MVRVSPLGNACVRGGRRALFSCSEHGLGRRRPEPSAAAAIPCAARPACHLFSCLLCGAGPSRGAAGWRSLAEEGVQDLGLPAGP